MTVQRSRRFAIGEKRRGIRDAEAGCSEPGCGFETKARNAAASAALHTMSTGHATWYVTVMQGGFRV